jgi:hypothetical protein
MNKRELFSFFRQEMDRATIISIHGINDYTYNFINFFKEKNIYVYNFIKDGTPEYDSILYNNLYLSSYEIIFIIMNYDSLIYLLSDFVLEIKEDGLIDVTKDRYSYDRILNIKSLIRNEKLNILLENI